jgi:hypothetical protein
MVPRGISAAEFQCDLHPPRSVSKASATTKRCFYEPRDLGFRYAFAEDSHLQERVPSSPSAGAHGRKSAKRGIPRGAPSAPRSRLCELPGPDFQHVSTSNEEGAAALDLSRPRRAALSEPLVISLCVGGKISGDDPETTDRILYG